MAVSVDALFGSTPVDRVVCIRAGFSLEVDAPFKVVEFRAPGCNSELSSTVGAQQQVFLSVTK